MYLSYLTGLSSFLNREDRQPEYSVFLGDLSTDCTEQILLVIKIFKGG